MLDFRIKMEIQSSSTESRITYPKFREEESLSDSTNGRTMCVGKKHYLNVYGCEFKRPRSIPLVSNWCELSNGISSRAEKLNKASSTNLEENQTAHSSLNECRPPESVDLTKAEDRTFCNGEHSRDFKFNGNNCKRSVLENDISRLKHNSTESLQCFDGKLNTKIHNGEYRKIDKVNGFCNGGVSLIEKQNIAAVSSSQRTCDNGEKNCFLNSRPEHAHNSIENQHLDSSSSELNKLSCVETTEADARGQTSNCVAVTSSSSSRNAYVTDCGLSKSDCSMDQPNTSCEDPSSSCKWINCNEKLKTAFDLKTHVKEVHVKTMAASDLFFCFWKGCKVYNKPSSSYNWLVKHVNTHVGIRPFQCFIDPCDQSFASQNALVRHVQSHFNERSKYYKKTKGSLKNSSNAPMKTKPHSPDEAGSGGESKRRELLSKKFKMSMRRRRPVTPNKGDAGFDSAAMDYIKKKLLAIESKPSFNGVKFQYNKQIIGRRITDSGDVEYLTNSTQEGKKLCQTEWIADGNILKTDYVQKFESENPMTS